MGWNDLLGRVQSGYAGLSPTRQKVIDFLLDEWQEAAMLPAGRLAKMIGVSESVITRTAAELGYSGFGALQSEFQERVREQLTLGERLERSTKGLADAEGLVTRVLEAGMENVRSVSAGNDVAQFETAVDRLLAARKVLVLGNRSTRASALYLGMNLNLMLGNAEAPDPTDGAMPERIRALGPSDVLVAFTFPRYGLSTLTAAREAHKRGAYLLAVTDSLSAPVARFAELTLTVQTGSVATARSATGVVFLVDILLALAALRAPERVRANLEEMDALLVSFRAFYGADDARWSRAPAEGAAGVERPTGAPPRAPDGGPEDGAAEREESGGE